ncbi:MAG: tyrosine-protein phosphatase [Fusobacteriaceae bacterium]
MMIDLHSHILNGVDDGSRDIEESLEMIKSAMELGFSGIVCTSHYKKERAENESYQERFLELKERVKRENLEVELYLGNEMFLGMGEIEDLNDGKINTYNRTRYLLVELDPAMPYLPAKTALEKIIRMGYKPVLAHIERYREIKIGEFLQLREMGVLFQVNIISIGNGSRERALKFLERGMVSFVTSDAHRRDKRSYLLKRELDEIREILGEENYREMERNTLRVVAGERINPPNLKTLKKKSFIEKILKKLGI